MNYILIIRAELICLVILLFITLYSRLYKMGKDQGSFLRICIYAIGHVIFDIITVITVNNLAVCPDIINKICHVLFYVFALLFANEFLCYTISLVHSKKMVEKVRLLGFILISIYVLMVPFLRIDYISGKGTNYSFGPAAFIGYGIALLFFISSILMVIINRKKIDKYVVGALIPMLTASILAEVVQILVPELLFTGGAITIITVGFFFSLENPVAVLRHKVFIDIMTGVRSRHSYDTAIIDMENRFKSGTQYGMVFCDINDLKAINDAFGHLEGDTYIAIIAQILINNLKDAEAIYRMGGDEFLAVYKDANVEVIKNEVEMVNTVCKEQSLDHEYPLSIAIGYAISDYTYSDLKDVLRTADYRMYINKAKTKLDKNTIRDNIDK